MKFIFLEKKGIKYLPLKQLLESTEIISLHLPKNTTILGDREFIQFGDGKMVRSFILSYF